jgi:Flp pilus assembly protein TadG
MTNRGVWQRRADEGSAAVEMALLVPVLTMILLGAIDFGRVFYAYITVSSAAHEAAVYAGRHFAPTVDVTPNALATVIAGESKGFLKVGTAPNGNTTVTGPTLVTDYYEVPLVQVQVTYSFRPMTPIPLKGPVPVSVTAASPMPGRVKS